ncbi:hypothetical protein BURPSS13_Q0092 [Burkholderia pseudomallei S13]|nr:hypothetical protein BURPSS13_Q0092 [Burkholderia pseudomallei S13]
MSAPIAASVSVVSIDPIAKAKGAAASGAFFASSSRAGGRAALRARQPARLRR